MEILGSRQRRYGNLCYAKQGTLKKRASVFGNSLLNKIHPHETLLMRIQKPPLISPLKIVTSLQKDGIMQQLQILADREGLHTRNLYGAIALIPISATALILPGLVCGNNK
jgi:hypothetical protein